MQSYATPILYLQLWVGAMLDFKAVRHTHKSNKELVIRATPTDRF